LENRGFHASWAPYTQLTVPEPTLTNSPRFDQLIQNGKLMLSLEDAISLALENNMDIAVQRFTPWLDESKSPALASGVNGRLLFDPTLTATGLIAQTAQPVNNPFLAGVSTALQSSTGVPVARSLVSHNAQGNFNYTRDFARTQLQVTFNNSRSSSKFAQNLFNPFSESTLTVQISQPLLNGFGRVANTRFIIEARNTVKVGESQFSQQVINPSRRFPTIIGNSSTPPENVKWKKPPSTSTRRFTRNNKSSSKSAPWRPWT